MGSGLYPADPKAAANASLCQVDGSRWACWVHDAQRLRSTYRPYYEIDRSAAGQTRYGGPGEEVSRPERSTVPRAWPGKRPSPTTPTPPPHTPPLPPPPPTHPPPP